MSIGRTGDTSELWLSSTAFPDGKGVQLHRAVVTEALGRLTRITMDFSVGRTTLVPQDLLGSRMTIHLRQGDDLPVRKFSGIAITVEALGLKAGHRHFTVELRPALWMLTRRRDNRVFQNKSVVEIIRDVLSLHAVSDIRFEISATYHSRDYCVQYNESDFDFVSRLMEEEGMFYAFDYGEAGDNQPETLVIADHDGTHATIEGPLPLPFRPHDGTIQMGEAHISEWTMRGEIVSGRVSLKDYDFQASRTDLLSRKQSVSDRRRATEHELYDYPGGYRDSARGDALARIRMEAEAVRHARRRGVGTVRALQTGRKMSLKPLPGVTGFDDEADFVITDAVCYLQEKSAFKDSQTEGRIGVAGLEIPEEYGLFTCEFGAIPAGVPFRPARTTRQPRIAGIHTALVTGPAGEEIHTDEHGRIKVRFHWDRVSPVDDTSSCWVRVATAWSGAGWGMIALPRVGQEVVVQFEEGDPDRPICTGMLYNDATRMPYDLPVNKTQLGLKTNSSTGGSGFNELMFEDRKDAELVRFQAQRDYQQIVQNDASISIGMQTGQPGNLTQVVRNDVSETIKEGNHTFAIEKGRQTITIEGDKAQTIDVGDYTLFVGQGSRDVTIRSDDTLTVSGKASRSITGDDTTSVGSGNIAMTAQTGKITLQAAQSIELKVGANSVKIDMSGVTINGMMVKVKAEAMAEISAPMTNVKASGVLILKGTMTMIN